MSQFSDEVLICDRRTSVCYKVGKSFRKYHKYGSQGQLDHEEQIIKHLKDKNINTPDWLGNGYSTKRKMYFTDYVFVDMESFNLNDLNKHDFHSSIILLANKLKDIDVETGNNIEDYFQNLKSEIETNRGLFENKVLAELREIIQCLMSNNNLCFIHGDFSLENIKRQSCNKKIIIYDFQRSGQGPESWDLAYFLASLEWAIVEKFYCIDEDLFKKIKLISAVKYLRGVRKNLEIKMRKENFLHWWVV